MKQTASALPVVYEILQAVKAVYAHTRLHWHSMPLTEKEVEEIYEKAENSFDVNGYSRVLVQGIKNGSTIVTKHVCMQDTIVIASVLYAKPRVSSYTPDWDTWGRCIALLSPHQPAHVVYYSNPQPRISPEIGKHVGAEHVNGGLTIQCNAKEIVIYRREEDVRVLIHELLHASCSDPYNSPTEYIEANTEAWAEILYCALMAKGSASQFDPIFHKQLIYALKQMQSLEKYHGVKSSQAYAWRYYNGKRAVWEQFGIQMPSESVLRSPIKSLRMTYKDI